MKHEYDFSRSKRGPVDPLPSGKTRITIRLDDEVLAWFKAEVHAAGGGNYQTLVNAALLEHIRRRREPLEETLRRVLREELPHNAAKPRRAALRAGGARPRV
jgi:BrnA antitoxin of type II toxin-antitoxin system